MLELEVLELEVQECWNLCLKWLEIDNGLRILLLRKSFCVKVFDFEISFFESSYIYDLYVLSNHVSKLNAFLSWVTFELGNI